MRKIIGLSALGSVALYALPLVAFAQVQSQSVLGVLDFFQRLFNGMIGLFITVAVVVFFWGLIRYIYAVDSQKAEGLQTMLWGVLAIFVMVSIWGIIRLVQNTFGVTNNAALTPGTVPTTIGNGLPQR